MNFSVLGLFGFCLLGLAFVFATVAPRWIDEHPDLPDIPPGESKPLRSFRWQLLWLLLMVALATIPFGTAYIAIDGI